MYAVIKAGGKQYKVAENQIVVVEKLAGEAGDRVAFDQVLLVGDDAKTTLGAPYVAGASVAAEVVEQGRGDKIVVFKKKRRKNHRRRNGHRQHETVVRITEILTDGKAPSKAAKPKAEAKSAAKPAKMAKPETEAPADTADTAAEKVEPTAKAPKAEAKAAAKSGSKADAKTAAPKDKPAAKASEE
jgi:large subunit ribosomal protein L21